MTPRKWALVPAALIAVVLQLCSPSVYAQGGALVRTGRAIAGFESGSVRLAEALEAGADFYRAKLRESEPS